MAVHRVVGWLASRKVPERLVGLAVTLMLLAVGHGIILQANQYLRSAGRAQTRALAEAEARGLAQAVWRGAAGAVILGEFVERGRMDGFEELAEKLLSTLNGITNLQLAPDGVVAQIYPLAGHEKALGRDLLRHDQRRTEAWEAIHSRRLTLAGPFELIQGGVAVVARQPVFIAGHATQLSRLEETATPDLEGFWGFASALIYLDDLLAQTALPGLVTEGYRFRLGRNHPDSGDWEPFAGDPPRSQVQSDNRWLPSMEPQWSRVAVAIPNGTWYLELSSARNGLSLGLLGMLYLLAIALGLLGGHWCFGLLVRTKELRRLVREETSALDAQNQRLTAEHQQLKVLTNAVEHSGNAIMITDPAGVIQYVNPRFCQVTGYRSTEVVGRTPALLRTHYTRDADYQNMWCALNAGQRWQGELRNRRKNGEVYWSSLSVAPVTDESGAVTHYVGISEDITPAKRVLEEIERLAYEDPLTGLGNRRSFMLQCDQALREVDRSGGWGALVYIDLDRFKLINDRYGHDVGDRLLQHVAGVIRQTVRRVDLAARLGGDEFILFLKDGEQPATAQRVVQQLIDRLAQSVELDGAWVQVSASIGIRFVTPDHPALEVLMSQADEALYQVKSGGRDGYRFYLKEDSEFDIDSTGAGRPSAFQRFKRRGRSGKTPAGADRC